MEITDEIILAIKNASKAYGGQKYLAAAVGIDAENISRWKNGKTFTIGNDLWEKLFPAIKDYLTSSYIDCEVKRIGSQPNSIGQIINGQINVYGVPNEKIISALTTSGLSEEKIKELKHKIFS